MSIEQKYIDLINADIDGEIEHVDKSEVDAFLRENEEARALHAELATLCGSIESIEFVTPPPHLRHVIMNSVKPTPAKTESPGFLQTLFATPALRYASVFAAGVLLTLSILSSDEISNHAFDDVTGLVGTISDPISGNLVNMIAVDKADIAGRVSLRNTGSMLILDFDLVANGPVEIEADYADRTVWFNGFAQLESSGTTISAKAGSVTLGMEGKRRYAVYLQNGGERGVTVNLRFLSGGEVVHSASLKYEPVSR
jgi:hypothetical protein